MSTPSAIASQFSGQIWLGRGLAQQTGPVWPTGHASLDAELPGGGWPGAALIELLCDQPGVGELSLLLPMLRQSTARPLQAWVCPPFLPYAPALEAAGIDLGSLLVLTPEKSSDAQWAIRQTLGSATCSLVLAWLTQIDTAGLRRLQLAAETGSTPLFLFRPLASARQPSPAPLRLALSAHKRGLSIDLVKRRGPQAHAPLILPLRSVWL